jgi:hypothetical protein
VEKEGFKKLERKEVMLNANDKLDIGDVVLSVGAISESIEVTGQIVWGETNRPNRPD